jgi:hypothetical protein
MWYLLTMSYLVVMELTNVHSITDVGFNGSVLMKTIAIVKFYKHEVIRATAL